LYLNQLPLTKIIIEAFQLSKEFYSHL